MAEWRRATDTPMLVTGLSERGESLGSKDSSTSVVTVVVIHGKVQGLYRTC